MTCAVADCTRPKKSRGWCEMHYYRWRRHGDPLGRFVRPVNVCTIPECGGVVYGHGWCLKHYTRWKRNGDPIRVRFVIGDWLERLASSLTVGDGCWEWTAHRSSEGYGTFHRDGRNLRAHRVVYELLVGPIPADLTIDHLCLNKGCVRPAHLEVVTRAENIARRNRQYAKASA